MVKMAQNHQKITFFDFQSVYTQNVRNFALIPNFRLFLKKIAKMFSIKFRTDWSKIMEKLHGNEKFWRKQKTVQKPVEWN